MKVLSLSLLGLLAATQGGECSRTKFATKCEGLGKTLARQFSNAKVNLTDFVEAGTNLTAPSTHATCAGFSKPFDFDLCRVKMYISTSKKSGFTLESWLPLDWTGRFLSVGNGGLGGCISYDDMAYAVARGFSVVGTNNGHDGNTGLPFYKNRQVLEDFAYRALHQGVVAGKKITKALYGKKHTKSYYLGCSTGGRQGFKEAQSFPDDFDGIVAGAPAFDFGNLQAWSGHFYSLTGPPGSSTFLTAAQWSLVVEDVLDQCDGLDGQVDGIIEDPDLCQYRPESLICGEKKTTNCITGTQAEVVRLVFSPLYDATGTLLYPRLQPGANATSTIWSGVPFQYSVDWWRYVIYDDPSWGPELTLDDIEAAKDVDTFGINTWDGDLSDVKNRGAKILHYHGLQDPIITSDNSARYYNHVSRTMGLRSEELDEFYRYFRISGMGHCSGGSGAYNIGNRQSAFSTEEPEGNVLNAMVQWVEKGIAPDYVLGTAYTNANKDVVAFERKHCKYPLRNSYKGTGDPNAADNWKCV
ncbi:tannase and feruloyl esterase [Dactylonectria macrodidyma]|uniref:Carboxylic ester hydrolase n=1 Tax=Dactylonectria macrodidyma TaxID=307937 RepID=A0A9P9FM89_9HYPO|nr:tannase and feruloyl esterase [Dactylonectria macrodidyma]